MKRSLRGLFADGITAIIALHILTQVSLELWLKDNAGVTGFLDIVIIVLLGLIWHSTWRKYTSDPQAQQKRFLFWAFTVVNIRQYYEYWLHPEFAALLADIMSLTVVYLVLVSQAKTVMLSAAQQRMVHYLYGTSAGLMMALTAVEKLTGLEALSVIYTLSFTVGHLAVVFLLFYWYYRASRTSMDPLVQWRFRLMGIGAGAYFSMFVTDMVARLVGGYDTPGLDVVYLVIKTSLIALGLYSIYLALSMGPRLAERLLNYSARRNSQELYSDLLILAARLSDTLAAETDNILSVYAVEVGKRYGGLQPSDLEVLRSAANAAYFLWRNELPDLRLPAHLYRESAHVRAHDDAAAAYADELYHLRRVSRIVQQVDSPMQQLGANKAVEARIIHIVRDYLRDDDLDGIVAGAYTLYDPKAITALGQWIEEFEVGQVSCS